MLKKIHRKQLRRKLKCLLKNSSKYVGFVLFGCFPLGFHERKIQNFAAIRRVIKFVEDHSIDLLSLRYMMYYKNRVTVHIL